MNGKDIVRYLRWIAVNDQAVMCPQLAKEAADFIEAALGIISTYDDTAKPDREERGSAAWQGKCRRKRSQ